MFIFTSSQSRRRREDSFAIFYPPLKQIGGCCWLFLRAQKESTCFTELAETVG